TLPASWTALVPCQAELASMLRMASGPAAAPGRPLLRMTPAYEAKPCRTIPGVASTVNGCTRWCQRAVSGSGSTRPRHGLMFTASAMGYLTREQTLCQPSRLNCVAQFGRSLNVPHTQICRGAGGNSAKLCMTERCSRVPSHASQGFLGRKPEQGATHVQHQGGRK